MKFRIQTHPWDNYSGCAAVSFQKVPGRPSQAIPQKWHPWMKHNMPEDVLTGPVTDFLDYMVTMIETTTGHEQEQADDFLKHMMIYAGETYFREYLEAHTPEQVPYLLWKHFIQDGDWYQLTVPAYKTIPTCSLIRYLSEQKDFGLNRQDIAKVLCEREDPEFCMPVETLLSIWL